MPLTVNEGDQSGHTRRAISLGALASGEKDPFAPEERNLTKDFGKAALLGAMGPVAGTIIGYAENKISESIQNGKNQPHLMVGIEILSAKGVPGFEYAQRKMSDGETIKIGIDASALIGNQDSKPMILIDARDPNNPEIKSLASALSNKAVSGALEFAQTIEEKNSNFPANLIKYEGDMKVYLDTLQSGAKAVSPGDRPISINPDTLLAVEINKVIKEVTSAPNTDTSPAPAPISLSNPPPPPSPPAAAMDM